MVNLLKMSEGVHFRSWNERNPETRCLKCSVKLENVHDPSVCLRCAKKSGVRDVQMRRAIASIESAFSSTKSDTRDAGRKEGEEGQVKGKHCH